MTHHKPIHGHSDDVLHPRVANKPDDFETSGCRRLYIHCNHTAAPDFFCDEPTCDLIAKHVAPVFLDQLGGQGATDIVISHHHHHFGGMYVSFPNRHEVLAVMSQINDNPEYLQHATTNATAKLEGDASFWAAYAQLPRKPDLSAILKHFAIMRHAQMVESSEWYAPFTGRGGNWGKIYFWRQTWCTMFSTKSWMSEKKFAGIKNGPREHREPVEEARSGNKYERRSCEAKN